MTLQEFAAMVRSMRLAQTRWRAFQTSEKTRNMHDWERRVDRALEELDAQQRLFDKVEKNP